MVQSAQCLLCKQESQTSIPRTQTERLGMVAGDCHPSPGELAWEDAQALLASHASPRDKLKASFCQWIVPEEQYPRLPSSCRAHVTQNMHKRTKGRATF